MILNDILQYISLIIHFELINLSSYDFDLLFVISEGIFINNPYFWKFYLFSDYFITEYVFNELLSNGVLDY